MSDELLDKAQAAIDDSILDEDISLFIKSRWKELDKREVKFIMCLLRGYPGWKAYQIAQPTKSSIAACKVQASRWCKKLDINFDELLEYAGHGVDNISEALDKLKEKDEDAYLRHIIKLKKLDSQKIEIDVKSLPVIEIVHHASIHSS